MFKLLRQIYKSLLTSRTQIQNQLRYRHRKCYLFVKQLHHVLSDNNTSNHIKITFSWTSWHVRKFRELVLCSGKPTCWHWKFPSCGAFAGLKNAKIALASSDPQRSTFDTVAQLLQPVDSHRGGGFIYCLPVWQITIFVLRLFNQYVSTYLKAGYWKVVNVQFSTLNTKKFTSYQPCKW